ncbi:hypothetical protein [Mycobacterium servetii]|uniref:Uncharacterized protein n=1 Tax=Mycobacterium servetii TaxID=3237418 RepID=A0ABV4BX56_9MYCO
MSEPSQPDQTVDRHEGQTGSASLELRDRRCWWHCTTLRVSRRIATLLLLAVLLAWLLPTRPWDVAFQAARLSCLATFIAVFVALWQSVVIRSRAQDEVREAHERLRRELKAAEQRSARELDNVRELHRIELEAQREQARIQRVQLREQEFKLALIRVSRAVNDYTLELAILTERGHKVVTMPEKQEREDALAPNSKKLDSLLKNMQLEISAAHMFTRNKALHDCLDAVNATTVLGSHAEAMFREAVIRNCTMPRPVAEAIFRAMTTMQTATGNIRRLAGELLEAGWE